MPDKSDKNIKVKKISFASLKKMYNMPFFDLLLKARKCHLKNWNASYIETASLYSIKTGGCPENCSYCPQSAHYKTGLEKQQLSSIDQVLEAAKNAKKMGAKRFCMGAAWRGPTQKQIDEVIPMIAGVKALGLETCATFGLLKEEQATQLKEAGLDFYNHNIDTSEAFYDKIITTRTFQDRLDTIKEVQKAGIKVCCGGIIGLGETVADRLKMIEVLAKMQPQPDSVPINKLIQVPGTPLLGQEKVDWVEFVKIIAITRLAMPKAVVRLSAGREDMSEELQALCFFAGANSIFYGDKLLTCNNPAQAKDLATLAKLNLQIEQCNA